MFLPVRKQWGCGKSELFAINFRMLGEDFFDVSRQMSINFSMSRDRLLLAGTRIHIDVVIRAGSHEYATVSCDLADEIFSLHRAMVFIRCSSGTSSMAIRR